MLGENWGLGQVLWTMIWFTVIVIWITLLFRVFIDIFRSHDMGGGAKALWVIFVIFMPYLGVFVYLIARGSKMAEHSMQDAKAQDDAMKAYVRDAAGSSPSEELAKLADLKAKGVIDEAEFQKMKAKVVS